MVCVSTTVKRDKEGKVLSRGELLRMEIKLNKVKKEYPNLKSITGLFLFNFLSPYLFLDLSISLSSLSLSLSPLSQIFLKRCDSASNECRPVEKENAKEGG